METMNTDTEERTIAVLDRPQEHEGAAESSPMRSESWTVAVAEMGGTESYVEAPVERVAEIEKSMDAIFEAAIELVAAEAEGEDSDPNEAEDSDSMDLRSTQAR